MAAYVHDTQFFTRRTVVLFAIIALHVFIFWALATGLAHRAIEVFAPPIQTEIVQEEQKKVEPPPPPPPEFQKPAGGSAAARCGHRSAARADADHRPRNVTTKHVEAPPPPPKTGNKVGAKPGKNFPNTEDYYPPPRSASARKARRTCTCASARTARSPRRRRIAQTSGSARLDEGALKLATAGSGHYQPATEDGKPIQDCFVFRIKFTMRK